MGILDSAPPGIYVKIWKTIFFFRHSFMPIYRFPSNTFIHAFITHRLPFNTLMHAWSCVLEPFLCFLGRVRARRPGAPGPTRPPGEDNEELHGAHGGTRGYQTRHQRHRRWGGWLFLRLSRISISDETRGWWSQGLIGCNRCSLLVLGNDDDDDDDVVCQVRLEIGMFIALSYLNVVCDAM